MKPPRTRIARRGTVITALLLFAAGAGCSPAAMPSSPTATATASLEPSAASATASTAAATPSPTPRPVGWRELTVTDGPGARGDHTWTVSEDGATAYLFGGRNGGTVLGDLWAYDLVAGSWRQVSATGEAPAARFGHNAAWVDGVGVVIFAGQAGSTFFNDLWAYDPAANAWTALPANGDPPVPRYGSCAAVGPDGRLWISHGFTQDGTRFSDTRAYDFATGTWADETPAGEKPIARCLHGCFWSEDRFVLYAGQTTGVTALGDLWALAAASGDGAWQRIDAALPEDRNLYAFAKRGSEVIVFGGTTHDGVFLADTFRFDATLAAAAIDLPSPAPAGRQGAQLIHDPGTDRLLLFGGVGEAGALADLWELVTP